MALFERSFRNWRRGAVNEQAFSRLSQRLELAAMALPYPPTPDLAAQVRPQKARPSLRLRWALAAALVLAASLLAVPSVRARVLEFLQVGAVGIRMPVDGQAEWANTTAQKQKQGRRGFAGSVLELDGETSLAAAREALPFPIHLPEYPAGLGEPDKVYVQQTEVGSFVVLAWLDGDGAVRLVQYVIGSGVNLSKDSPQVVRMTEVHGNLAVWTNDRYPLHVEGEPQLLRFVDNPALIWMESGLTYRLEGAFTLEQMTRIAESIPREP